MLRMRDAAKTNAVMEDVFHPERKLCKTLLSASGFRKHLHSSSFSSNLGHFVMDRFSCEIDYQRSEMHG